MFLDQRTDREILGHLHNGVLHREKNDIFEISGKWMDLKNNLIFKNFEVITMTYSAFSIPLYPPTLLSSHLFLGVKSMTSFT